MAYLILDEADLADLKPESLADVLTKLKLPRSRGQPFPIKAPPQMGEEFKHLDMDGVSDLTLKDVQTWMEAASDKTKSGLRVFAELGPVIKAKDLIDIGIDNISHFQSRVTIRTRTVTGDKSAFLFGWDDWEIVDYGEGKYGVTPITHQSLRRYFRLE